MWKGYRESDPREVRNRLQLLTMNLLACFNLGRVVQVLTSSSAGSTGQEGAVLETILTSQAGHGGVFWPIPISLLCWLSPWQRKEKGVGH